MRWHLGTLVAMPLVFVSAANAQMLRCRGDLVFEDSMARRVTLLVDPAEGSVKNLRVPVGPPRSPARWWAPSERSPMRWRMPPGSVHCRPQD